MKATLYRGQLRPSAPPRPVNGEDNTRSRTLVRRTTYTPSTSARPSDPFVVNPVQRVRDYLREHRA